MTNDPLLRSEIERINNNLIIRLLDWILSFRVRNNKQFKNKQK